MLNSLWESLSVSRLGAILGPRSFFGWQGPCSFVCSAAGVLVHVFWLTGVSQVVSSLPLLEAGALGHYDLSFSLAVAHILVSQ